MSAFTELKNGIDQIGVNFDAFKKVNDQRLAEIKSAQDEDRARLEELEGKSRTPGRADRDPSAAQPKLLTLLTKSPQFADAQRGQSSGRIELEVSLKDLLSTQAGGSPNTGVDVQAQRWSGFAEDPRRQLSLLSVLPRLPVTSNAFEYAQLDGYSNAATYQTTEGAEKQQAGLPTTLRSAPIKTIAHWIRASRQVLADVPALQNYLSQLLQYGVLAKAESEIVAGATSGGIDGLATQAGAVTTTATKAPDQLSEVIASLRGAGWNPDLVILNPTDAHKIRTLRASGGSEEYLASDWAAGAGPQSIWGLSFVETPSLAAGTGIVLDRSTCAILDREQATILIDPYSGMTSNLVTILAEIRLGFAVLSPSGVKKLTLAY